jgi:hypothetical protein
MILLPGMNNAAGREVQCSPGSNRNEAMFPSVELPPKFHPAAVSIPWGFRPVGAVGATGDRRSWSGLRSLEPGPKDANHGCYRRRRRP